MGPEPGGLVGCLWHSRLETDEQKIGSAEDGSIARQYRLFERPTGGQFRLDDLDVRPQFARLDGPPEGPAGEAAEKLPRLRRISKQSAMALGQARVERPFDLEKIVGDRGAFVVGHAVRGRPIRGAAGRQRHRMKRDPVARHKESREFVDRGLERRHVEAADRPAAQRDADDVREVAVAIKLRVFKKGVDGLRRFAW